MLNKAKAGACDAGLHDHCSIGERVRHTEKISAAQGLDAGAEGFVRHLLDAGAVDLQTDGDRWWHDCRPGDRDACRRIKAQHDLTAPGMTEAIVRAIRRLNREAA